MAWGEERGQKGSFEGRVDQWANGVFLEKK
jgi:hypothetical protein